MSVSSDRVRALAEEFDVRADEEDTKAFCTSSDAKIIEFRAKEKTFRKCAKRVLGLIEPGETG